MSIEFPIFEEVKLGRSPLSEVICQVKFPPILKIGAEKPVNFQDQIRHLFPEYKEEYFIPLNIETSASDENIMPLKTPKLYHFLNIEDKMQVTLSQDFVALSTQKYSHWQDFSRNFKLIEQAFFNEYKLSYINWLGLRFINRITCENSGCGNLSELLNLFRDELTCLFKTDAWQEPQEMIFQATINDLNAKLNFRFGYSREKDEPFFLVDLDNFEDQKMDASNLGEKIEKYHDTIYRAFRWCLKDGSLQHFSPILRG